MKLAVDLVCVLPRFEWTWRGAGTVLLGLLVVAGAAVELYSLGDCPQREIHGSQPWHAVPRRRDGSARHRRVLDTVL